MSTSSYAIAVHVRPNHTLDNTLTSLCSSTLTYRPASVASLADKESPPDPNSESVLLCTVCV